jgi:hypothetical protein
MTQKLIINKVNVTTYLEEIGQAIAKAKSKTTAKR